MARIWNYFKISHIITQDIAIGVNCRCATNPVCLYNYSLFFRLTMQIYK